MEYNKIIDDTINDYYQELKKVDLGSKDAVNMADSMVKLIEARKRLEEKPEPEKSKGDKILEVVGKLQPVITTGIAAATVAFEIRSVLYAEKNDDLIVRSKAFNLIPKLKL